MRRAVPQILLALGLVAHALVLAGPIWDEAKGLNEAEDFATYYYAIRAADQGRDPYERGQLSALARKDRTPAKAFSRSSTRRHSS